MTRWGRAWRSWLVGPEEPAGERTGLTKAEVVAVCTLVLWGVAYFLAVLGGAGCARLCPLAR